MSDRALRLRERMDYLSSVELGPFRTSFCLGMLGGNSGSLARRGSMR